MRSPTRSPPCRRSFRHLALSWLQGASDAMGPQRKSAGQILRPGWGLCALERRRQTVEGRLGRRLSPPGPPWYLDALALR
jgi:hypothetical protein